MILFLGTYQTTLCLYSKGKLRGNERRKEVFLTLSFRSQDEALRDWSKSFSADPIHTHKGKPIPRGIRYVMKFCASVNPSALKEDIEGEEEGEEEEEEEQEEQQKSTPLSPKTKQTK